MVRFEIDEVFGAGFAAFFQVAWVLLLLGGKQLNPKA